MKVTLFLMSEKGLKVLKSIIEYNLINLIDKVVLNKDKAVINDFSEELENVCLKNKINYLYFSDLEYIDSEYSIAISWRWLIKKTNTKLIVLHDSILPRYRGFAPLVNSLINKESFIGVTALFASEEYDKGEIIYQGQSNITYPITIQEAINKVSSIYSELVIKILLNLSNNLPLESYEQNENFASYSLWRDDDDYYINWNKSSEYISRFVDAVGFPYVGAKSKINEKTIIIEKVVVVNDLAIENRDVGKIIFFDNKKPIVVCGEGLIKIQNAIYEDTGESIFPLSNFRIKFK